MDNNMNEEEKIKILKLKGKLIELLGEYGQDQFTGTATGLIIMSAQLTGMTEEGFLLFSKLSWDRVKEDVDKINLAQALINSVMQKDGT